MKKSRFSGTQITPMRKQFILDLNQELIVVNFSAGGGTAPGIYLAIGRPADLAWEKGERAA